MSISTTARGKLTKVIETLATINLCFDDFIKDPALLYETLCWVEDELVRIKGE